MVPLKAIKVKSANVKKKNGKVVLNVADPSESYFKRDVTSIMKTLKEKLKNEKPVEQHVYQVLMKTDLGKTTSLGQQLQYKYTLKLANALADHDYCGVALYNENIIRHDINKEQRIVEYIHKPVSKTNTTNIINEIVNQNKVAVQIEKSFTVYIHKTDEIKNLHADINKQMNPSNKEVIIDISFLEAPKPRGTNYFNISQNTTEWQSARYMKITGSRLPAL